MSGSAPPLDASSIQRTLTTWKKSVGDAVSVDLKNEAKVSDHSMSLGCGYEGSNMIYIRYNTFLRKNFLYIFHIFRFWLSIPEVQLV